MGKGKYNKRGGRSARGKPVTVTAFLAQVQDYCNAEYTPTQLKEVAAWAGKKSERRLDLVYRYIVKRWDTQYKKLPTIRNLDDMNGEMCETFPQLNVCYEKPIGLITDGGSREEVASMLAGLCKKLNMRKATTTYRKENDFS